MDTVRQIRFIWKPAVFLACLIPAFHAIGDVYGVTGNLGANPVENLQDRYDVVCSRAFASLADFVQGSRRALAPGGRWLAMKGQHPAAEIAALPADCKVFHVEQLLVPGLQAQRCIVWMGAAEPA